ncbi:MAG: AAA family ATPase [Clostridia bacterium]|nr:AAA family ATPase [Clostridia bacterium]
MKILSLDIAAFGKFKNYHLDLPDNMTVVFGENENGKSTVMSFIRMMFYGNTGKTSDIDKNPRIKYRPWDSELMAGSITFEHSGKNYRLEREFKKSNSTDKITLIDLDTGIPASLSGSDDIGAKFFGLTDAAFERSVFLSESIPTSKNEAANGEINSRLSNAATTGNDDISFEKISSKLQKAKEALFSRSGKKGLYDKAIAERESVAQEIKAAEENEKRLDEIRADIAEKKPR